MDPGVWSNLPTDLALKIIGHLDDIDTRLAFKVPPKKLVIDKNFQFRNEIVYDNFSKTLWDFTHLGDEDPYLLVRKNIKFSQFRLPDRYIFNMGWEDYEMTMFCDQYTFGPTTFRNHYVTNKKIKFV